MEIPVNKNNADLKGLQPAKLNFLLALVLALCGVMAGYFATIYEIKMNLAHKADNQALINLERRVFSLEIYLKERMVTRDDFYLFKESLEKRLNELEYERKAK
jgi:hypothetical protein